MGRLPADTPPTNVLPHTGEGKGRRAPRTSAPAQPAGPSEPPLVQAPSPRVTPVRLPYEPRPGQPELAQAARLTFLTGGQAVLEAGTGTGKTVAVLAAALEATELNGKTILWLTRTNSQSRQVIHEFRALTAGQAERPLALALQGRAHGCPQFRDDPRYQGASAEEYSRLCGSLKRRTLSEMGRDPWGVRPVYDDELEDGVDDAPTPQGRSMQRKKSTSLPMAETRGCPYYAALLETDPADLLAELKADPLDPERLGARLEERGVCPYEAVKGLLQEARLIVAPYIYLADPRLTRAMKDWLRSVPDDWVLVVDEAHNLPEYLRALHSPELSTESLKRARTEALEAGDPPLREGLSASAMVGVVEEALHAVAAERLLPGEEDALLPPDEVTIALMEMLRMTTIGLRESIDVLLTVGESVRDAQQRAGRLPRSYLGSLGSFLSAWMAASPSEHVHVVVGGEDPRLVLFCMDPSIGTHFLTDAHAVVHMSGTLRPLEQYRDLLALDEGTTMQSIPSPYPPENLRLIMVDDVTTRYEARMRDPAMMDRLHDHLNSLAALPGLNLALFFPSHELLREAREMGLEGHDRRLFVEAPGMQQSELMASLDVYRREGERTAEGGPGSVWLGVMGGRVSEGMDFPGRALEAAALIGVPFPKPTARQRALVRFNEIRFGKGWEYAVEAPVLRKVLQTLGRVIRDADDRGVVFLFDARYRRYADHLPRLESLPIGVTAGEVLAEWLETRGAVLR